MGDNSEWHLLEGGRGLGEGVPGAVGLVGDGDVDHVVEGFRGFDD